MKLPPLVLVLFLGSCSKAPDAPAAGPTRTFTDFRGKSLAIPWPPKRIVSTVPSLTEMLYAVGAQELLVGVTTYCSYPPEAVKKPKIGSLMLDYEALSQLRPEWIATSVAVAHKSVAELESQGYKVFSVDPRKVEEIPKALRLLGAMTDHEAQGEAAAAAFEAKVKGASAPPGPSVYFEHSADPLGTAGPASYLGDAIRLAGGRNIFDGGWRLIDWESVLAGDPEVILVSHERKDSLALRAGWANLKAVKSGRVYFVNKENYLYPTPRLAEGIVETARLLHAKNP